MQAPGQRATTAPSGSWNESTTGHFCNGFISRTPSAPRRGETQQEVRCKRQRRSERGHSRREATHAEWPTKHLREPGREAKGPQPAGTFLGRVPNQGVLLMKLLPQGGQCPSPQFGQRAARAGAPLHCGARECTGRGFRPTRVEAPEIAGLRSKIRFHQTRVLKPQLYSCAATSVESGFHRCAEGRGERKTPALDLQV